VIDGKTGFLYTPDSLLEFVRQVERILQLQPRLQTLQTAAREQVRIHFEQHTNLERFAELFLERLGQTSRGYSDENLILQQI